MVKNLKRFRKQVEREQGRLGALKCDFFPTTYVLPVCSLIDLEKKTNRKFKFSQNIIYLSKNLNEIRIQFGL